MSDKDDLTTSIEKLSLAREEKDNKLREAVKTVSENRRIARERQSRPT